jgi:hypothetical protein
MHVLAELQDKQPARRSMAEFYLLAQVMSFDQVGKDIFERNE